MKEIFARRITNSGLVLPPPREDCNRETCHTAVQQGRCFLSRHHLYWPAVKFNSNELAKEFRDHRFNSVYLPRCQHDRYHDQYAQAAMPPNDIILTFLDEAKELERFGVVLDAIQAIEAALVATEYKQKARDAERYRERLGEFTEESIVLRRGLTRLEVIEPRLVVPHFGEAVPRVAA